MPINVYTGVMGSGKTYECVASVIVPAIKQGRRVVTNIRGINEGKIHEYITLVLKGDPDCLGSVVSVKDEDVKAEGFFPSSRLADGSVDDDATTVKGGDLVALDEAWRFFGPGEKITEEQMTFFREHRHYVSKSQGVSCDIVLMVQDINDLQRKVKNVVEFNFRFKKLKSLGFSRKYAVGIWEGYKQTKSAAIKNYTRNYDPVIFPLYSSYGGGKGKEVSVDRRTNVFAGSRFLFLLGGVLLMCVVGLFFVLRAFDADNYSAAPVHPIKPINTSPQPPPPAVEASAAIFVPPVSASWRIVGHISAGDASAVLLADSSGRLRREHPSACTFLRGRPMVCEVDGERVTPYGGAPPAPQEKAR